MTLGESDHLVETRTGAGGTSIKLLLAAAHGSMDNKSKEDLNGGYINIHFLNNIRYLKIK